MTVLIFLGGMATGSVITLLIVALNTMLRTNERLREQAGQQKPPAPPSVG